MTEKLVESSKGKGQPCTLKPAGAPSTAICLVFITVNGNRHVVKPCMFAQQVLINRLNDLPGLGPGPCLPMRTRQRQRLCTDECGLTENIPAPTKRNFLLSSLRQKYDLSSQNKYI